MVKRASRFWAVCLAAVLAICARNAVAAPVIASATKPAFCPALPWCALPARAAPTSPPVSSCVAAPAAIERVAHQGKRVALTFDACSSGQYLFDAEVYRVLEDLRVRATIFMGGEWVERQRQTARRVANNPLLEVASHGYHHPHWPALGAQELEFEMHESQRAIYRELGIWPTLIRAPYGEINAQALETAARLGLKVVQYDLPSGDPDPALKADAIVRWVVDSAKEGSVVVFHINRNGVHTAETLPRVVRELRARGFELVRVSELLGQPVTFTDGALCQNPEDVGPPENAPQIAWCPAPAPVSMLARNSLRQPLTGGGAALHVSF